MLLGSQGDERITAEELGGHVGTIGYEIVVAIGERVPRVHVGEQPEQPAEHPMSRSGA